MHFCNLGSPHIVVYIKMFSKVSVTKQYLFDQSHGQRGLGDLSSQVASQSTGIVVDNRRSPYLTTSTSQRLEVL